VTYSNGRAPPHDLAAEAAVLSSALLDVEAVGKLGFLEPQHFFVEAHRRVFSAVRALQEASRPVDLVQVAGLLRDRGQLEQVGGTPYLVEVLNAAPAVANVADYGRRVLEKARLRAIIANCQVTELQAYGDVGDSDAWLAERVSSFQKLGAPIRGGLPWVESAELAKPLPPLRYLVRELGLVAGGGSPHLVAGYGFSGKTAALQALLLALAAGRPVWGAYPVSEPLRVTHVDLPGEQGQALSQRRYQRLATTMGVDLEAIPRGGGRLRILAEYPLSITAACAPQWREAMAGMDLILIDSLRAGSPGLDENSSEFRAGLDSLSEISVATGCRALVIHHARKKSKDDPGGAQIIRGSSGIFDACDSVYVFSGEKGEPTRCEHAKARSHGELVPDWVLSISDDEHDGNPRAGLKIVVQGIEVLEEARKAKKDGRRQSDLKTDCETIRGILRTTPGLTSRALRSAAHLQGLGSARADLAIQALITDGELTGKEEQQGRNWVLKHYLLEAN
jgi:AAA domain/DnaB-like helicase N terminal domain